MLRPILEILAIDVTPIGLRLPLDRGQAAVEQLLRHVDAEVAGIGEGEEHRGGGETVGARGRLAAADPEVVVAPAAVDRLVAVEELDLAGDARRELLLKRGIACGPAVEQGEGLDTVGMAPHVVERVGGGPPQIGQVVEQPHLAAVDRRCDSRTR